MNTYIALFRGINVGGNNILPMKELRTLLGELGLQNVNTYIQTGNVVFQSDSVAPAEIVTKIQSCVNERYGFKPEILLLEFEEMEEVIRTNPFSEDVSNSSRLYLSFLISEPGNPDLEELESIKKESEQFALKNNVFYLHAPDGIGRSKLAAKTEKLLGVSITRRNWRTVQKIMDMVDDWD
jgi:uncharacterized protein (DUF1697 family)